MNSMSQIGSIIDLTSSFDRKLLAKAIADKKHKRVTFQVERNGESVSRSGRVNRITDKLRYRLEAGKPLFLPGERYDLREPKHVREVE